jgi:hypothetical protein
MAYASEISFWQKHADQGTLLAAVRVFQSRAELFFGAFALMRADESMLLRILDAQAIVAASNHDLLITLNKRKRGQPIVWFI